MATIAVIRVQNVFWMNPVTLLIVINAIFVICAVFGLRLDYLLARRQKQEAAIEENYADRTQRIDDSSSREIQDPTPSLEQSPEPSRNGQDFA